MQERSKEKDFKANYLLDKDCILGNAFGARTTPHVFLFNKFNKLVYTGSIDNTHARENKVKDNYLIDALNSLGKGIKIKTPKTKNMGCRIRRVD